MTDTVQGAAVPAAASKPSRRIAGIDLAEAICILIVVVYHLSMATYKVYYHRDLLTAFNYYVRCFYAAGCPIFFMSNGYLLFHHSFDLKKHLKKTRWMILLTLFWFAVTFVAVSLIKGNPLTFAAFREEWQSFIDVNIHLWYMGALVVIYLLFPLMKLAYDTDKRVFFCFWLYVFLANFGTRLLNQGCTLYGYLFHGYRSSETDIVWLSIFNLFNNHNGIALSYFGIGAFLPEITAWIHKRLPKTGVRNAVLTVSMLVCAFIHGLWFLFMHHVRGWYMCPVWFGFNTLPNLVISISLLLLCMNYQGKNRKTYGPIRKISNGTLGIYLLHEFFVQPLRILMPRYTPWLCNLTGNILVSCVIIALCMGIAALFHKTPGLKKLL